MEGHAGVPCVDVVTICPYNFRNHYSSDPDLSQRISRLRHKDLGSGVYLEVIGRVNIALTLVHELSHAKCFLSNGALGEHLSGPRIDSLCFDVRQTISRSQLWGLLMAGKRLRAMLISLGMKML
jgi:hypothetical protein